MLDMFFPNDLSANPKYLGNAGTIKGNGTSIDEPTYIAGVVAYSVDNPYLFSFVNIGKIEGEGFDYVGGIVASFINSTLYGGSNAGMVEGGRNSTGGIVGYFENSSLFSAINTN